MKNVVACVEAQRSATSATESCVDEMEYRHRREPVVVDRDDRRARFP